MAIVDEKKVKKAVTAGVKYAAGGAGLGAGIIGQVFIVDNLLGGPSLSKLSFLPETIRKIVPGGIMILLASWGVDKVSDPRLKAAITGAGISGGADILRRLVGPYVPWILANVPGNGMNGLKGKQGYAPINVGDFQYSYYKENAFQGVPGKMSMQGNTMRSFQGSKMSMQGGPGAYALNGAGAYALNGVKPAAYALNGRRRKRSLRGTSYLLS